MPKLPFRSLPMSAATLLAICLAAASAQAQNPAAQPTTGAAATQAQPELPIPATRENDELLAKAAKLYYSSARAGLEGFDCTVHTDWRSLFASANKNTAITEDDPRVALLKSVGITLHARMKGGSTVEWIQASSPDRPLDEDSNATLEGVHKATEQTLQGFLQFWTPFFDGSVVPASSKGLRIETSATGYNLGVEDGSTTLKEIFNNSLTLEEFDVVRSGSAVKFNPSYKATDKGMLVDGFEAHIQPPGKTPEQAAKMRVQVAYQTVDNVPIPARVNIEVVGNAIFNFDFDGCTVNSAAK